MKIEIVYNNTYYEVNPERISKDERLDEVLDSVKFCFISNELTTDIPPFTKAVITDGNIIEYYYCSTTCDEIVEMPGFYYHTALLVEATKILETFDIGTKTFSVIPYDSTQLDVNHYNRNSSRLIVLNTIVLNKYGYTINLSQFVQNTFSLFREYSFGAGTTYFDIALEICKTQNCLPYVSYISDDGKTLTLDAHNMNMETSIISRINVYSKKTKTQSVDEYCNDVVTEMDSVVDRDNLTTCILTPRSTSETIYKDNALLRLPTNVERVKNLCIWLNGYDGPTCKIPAEMLNFTSDVSYDNDKLSSVNLTQWVQTYSKNSIAMTLIQNWVSEMETRWGHNQGYYDEAIVYWQKDDYALLLIWNSVDYAWVTREGWTSIGLLNKEQWSLLSTDEQPAFIYYESDTNVIDGFNNNKDNDFWNAMIFGSKGPFLKQYFKQGVDANYIRPLKYVDFDEKATSKSYGIYTINYVSWYHMYYPDGSTPSYSILDYKWKVDYYPKCHIGATESKSIQPENELTWKKSTRSYNNGANTVDFNLLIPNMKRSANMLGLETTSVEALDDINVGRRTQFGYIVSKQSDFNLINGKKVINNVVYNCCQNYRQIAQAIGIDTQYEATNVPSTGIVTRYITIEKQVDETLFNQIAFDDRVLLFVFYAPNNIVTMSKMCTRMVYDNTIYLVCETEDNYTFDYAKVNSNTSSYYKRDPVPYADENQCIENGRCSLEYMPIENSAFYSIADLDNYPRSNLGNPIPNFDDTIYIGKDSRERLIFQYKITKI